jgi:hypothetical protein
MHNCVPYLYFVGNFTVQYTFELQKSVGFTHPFLLEQTNFNFRHPVNPALYIDSPSFPT